ncbi:MAG: TIGR03435 family protein [Candidatus Solibacter sp.]
MRVIMLLTLGVLAGFGQGFDVASVKVSAHVLGKDTIWPIAISPTGLIAHNVTLKRLIGQAYDAQPFQIIGGPGWLDSDEYDVEAKVSAAASREQMKAMLRSLLAERFALKVHTDSVTKQVYELRPGPGGVRIHPVKEGETPKSGTRVFRGEMRQFANFLGVQLSIPPIEGATRPSFAAGPAVPVLDRTGLEGIFEIATDVRPEAGADMFTLWQRALRELGLRLVVRANKLDAVVIDGASPTPARELRCRAQELHHSRARQHAVASNAQKLVGHRYLRSRRIIANPIRAATVRERSACGVSRQVSNRSLTVAALTGRCTSAGNRQHARRGRNRKLGRWVRADSSWR